MSDATGSMALKMPTLQAKKISDDFVHKAEASTIPAALTVSSALNVNGTVTFGAGAALNLDTDTAAAVADAVTINKMAGVIGTTALTDGATVQHTITLTNSTIAAVDLVKAWVQAGTNTTGFPIVGEVAPGAGSCTIKFINAGTAALNGNDQDTVRGIQGIGRCDPALHLPGRSARGP